MTPEEKKEYHRRYREKNYERLKQKRDEWKKANIVSFRQKEKEYREKNKEKHKQYIIRYREENKEKLTQTRKERWPKNKEKHSITSKLWVENNREHLREYRLNWTHKNKERIKNINKINRKSLQDYLRLKKRMAKDPIVALIAKTRSIIKNSFRRRCVSKKSKTCQILGCAYEEFMEYMIVQYETTYGKPFPRDLNGLEVHHKIPLLDARSEEDVIRLNHYTNLIALERDHHQNMHRGIYN